jgi:alginate O-acetyltransferase complex protein AlgI
MNLLQIAALLTAALVIGRLRAGRKLALLGVSVAALFWLQPPQTVASLGFWIPYATLAILILSWILTSATGATMERGSWHALAIMAGIVLLVEASRNLPVSLGLSVVPPVAWILAAITVLLATLAALAWVWKDARRALLAVLAGCIVLIFVVLKTPGLANLTISGARTLVTGVVRPPGDSPVAWLGFSYIAFRLLHTIRDRRTGRLPAVDLSEYTSYVIFFPAFTAGPIDRIERFVQDLRQPAAPIQEEWLETGKRIIMGLFKKFVVADLLAVISLNDVFVPYIKGVGWMWLFLYAYAFRIYFDFSGYTDLAIGMGRLVGFRLPENFESPYLKPNLALFWNSWHMTLTQWFRSYVFNPLAREFRTNGEWAPTWIALLTTQVVTMVLIGLWHGITWSFVLWGLWHGLGLFAHNRWASWARSGWSPRFQDLAGRRPMRLLGTALTFNYVAVGWVFFGLSSPGLTWLALRKLVGAA